MSEARQGDGPVIQRLFSFSDSVFGIALTLLVLDLRPPEATTAAAMMGELRALVLPLVAFAGTFAVVSFFWIAHVAYLRRLVVFDWPVAWCNLLLLFFVALTPFASATLGRHSGSALAWQVYAAAMIAISLAQTMTWLTVSRGKGRLMGGVGWRERAHRTLRGLSPGIAFAIAFALADRGRMDLAVWSPLLIAPLIWLAGLLFGARPLRP